jgi:hypothetical protein
MFIFAGIERPFLKYICKILIWTVTFPEDLLSLLNICQISKLSTYFDIIVQNYVQTVTLLSSLCFRYWHVQNENYKFWVEVILPTFISVPSILINTATRQSNKLKII